MSMRGSIKQYKSGPFPLLCPCGKPLEIAFIEIGAMETHKEWAIGHFDCMESPITHGGSLREVMSLVIAQLEKLGHYPNRAEHLAESDKDALEYNRDAPEKYKT